MDKHTQDLISGINNVDNSSFIVEGVVFVGVLEYCDMLALTFWERSASIWKVPVEGVQ